MAILRPTLYLFILEAMGFVTVSHFKALFFLGVEVGTEGSTVVLRCVTRATAPKDSYFLSSR